MTRCAKLSRIRFMSGADVGEFKLPRVGLGLIKKEEGRLRYR